MDEMVDLVGLRLPSFPSFLRLTGLYLYMFVAERWSRMLN